MNNVGEQLKKTNMINMYVLINKIWYFRDIV